MKVVIDRSMILPKLFYFFQYGAWASLGPYLVIYYQNLGLVGSQIGVLASIPPLMTLIGSPIWGGLADATRKTRALLGVAITLTMGMVLVMSFTRSFWLLIPVVILYAFNNAPIIPLVDSTVMDMLGERRTQYGRQRLWGAIGWGVAAPIAGALIERYGLRWAFYAFLVQMFIVLLVTLRLPISPGGLGKRFWAGVRQLLHDKRWGVFLGVVFISGIGGSSIHNFLFLHLDGLGASETLMGIFLTVATLSELPVFFFSDRMLNRWGARNLIAFSLFVFVLRAMAYAFIKSPWLSLPVQLLHGLTFSIMWAAGSMYARQIAPAGMGATAQSLFISTNFGLGAMAGALICGALYQAIGSAGMYFWMGCAILAAAVAFVLLVRNQQEAGK